MGPFCHKCGQKYRRRLPTLMEFTADSLKSALELDGPMLRTFRSLMLKPGQVTGAYISGNLSNYWSPTKTFLFCSAYYFLVTSALGRRSFLFLRTAEERAQDYRESSSFLLVALIPLFASYLYLNFRRTRFPYIVDLVASTHLHCAWFLFLGTFCILQWCSDRFARAAGLGDLPTQIGMLACLVYLALHLRCIYRLSPIQTLIQAVCGLLVYCLLLALVIRIHSRILGLLSDLAQTA